MKKLLLLVGLAIIGVASWYIWETRKKPKDETPEQPPVVVSKYSLDFIRSVDSALADYYILSESLVRWDSVNVNENAAELKESFQDIKFKELEKDSLIYQTAKSYTQTFNNDLDAFIQKVDMTDKRHLFNSMSQNLYDLLRAIRYDGGKVYLQECPMAFNDTEAGIWLSKTSPIRNPYLGLHHPKYKSGMLECGETKDSLAFMMAAK
jgi:hypothetical protein